MVCVSWPVCSTLDENIAVVDEVNSDVFSSVRGDGDAEDEGVLVVENVASAVEPLSSVDDSNVFVFTGVSNVDCAVIVDSDFVLDGNSVVCVCSLVCSILDEDISIVDEVNSDVFASVKGDGGAEDEGVLVVDNVASAVELLSSVDDSNVFVFKGVSNVDCAAIVDSDSVVDGN